MSLRTVAWDDPALAVRGALDLASTPHGLSPRRLPAWTEPQFPDPAVGMTSRMTSGVRLAFRTDARRLELDVLVTGLRLGEGPRRPVDFDLFVDGQLHGRLGMEGGQTIVVETAPFRAFIERGEPGTIAFEGLPGHMASVEIWLPQSASVELRALRIPAVARLEPSPAGGRRWIHYGSSISHGMEAEGPSETWPGRAARLAGVELTSLGLAGQCHLDGFVARTLRDAPTDLVSLKLGINVLNADSMRERVFAPAVDGFLDTLRDGKPDTPILVISPILCPVIETHPGPTLMDGPAIRAPERPAELSTGALTLERVRQILEAVVARRRGQGDVNLHYLDGRALFGEADLGDLPDGLHPNARGLKRMGDRFVERAFGPGGAFCA